MDGSVREEEGRREDSLSFDGCRWRDEEAMADDADFDGEGWVEVPFLMRERRVD